MSQAEKIALLPGSIYETGSDSFMGKLWAIFTDELAVVESVNTQISEVLDIYNQTGVNLDRIGELVNEPRNSRPDEQYRIRLFVALMKKLSSGSVKDVLDVGRALINDGEFYVTQELCYLSGEELLDGTKLLDGRTPLSGSKKRPGSFEMMFSGPVNQIEVPMELGKAIDEIRAAGVHGKVRVKFVVNVSDMTMFTEHHSTLNGEGLLDGKTMLSPEADLNVERIGLGDGAHPGGVLRVPESTDTDLQNEVLLRDAESFEEAGLAGVKIDVHELELNSNQIDEIKLECDAGLIALASFNIKEKDNTIIYEFAAMENEEWA